MKYVRQRPHPTFTPIRPANMPRMAIGMRKSVKSSRARIGGRVVDRRRHRRAQQPDEHHGQPALGGREGMRRRPKVRVIGADLAEGATGGDHVEGQLVLREGVAQGPGALGRCFGLGRVHDDLLTRGRSRSGAGGCVVLADVEGDDHAGDAPRPQARRAAAPTTGRATA